MRRALVVMGTAGSGKTLIGSRLADAIGARFVEGDQFHPPANIARMAAGTPLTDDDRHDWLVALSQQLAAARAEECGVVVSCSALKRRYRDLLRHGDPSVRFIFLHGEPALLRSRLEARTGHYMAADMLESQLEILEAPAPDERAWSFDVRTAPEAIVRTIIDALTAETGDPDS
ncbi:MAG: gluconokinase [Gemmatimonadaceae bacterium]|nr:gluconokinase [Gemmatimonadaceae bacterium]